MISFFPPKMYLIGIFGHSCGTNDIVFFNISRALYLVIIVVPMDGTRDKEML